MEIAKVQNNRIALSINRISQINYAKMPYYGIKMPAAINTDTVSFGIKAKKVSTLVTKELKAAAARQEARDARDLKQILERQSTKPEKKELDSSERSRGISYSTAIDVHAAIVKPQQRIFTFIHKLFDEFLITDTKQKNLVLHIQDRAKSSVSIMEKSATRDWNSKDEVLEKMTDLNGAKLVMGYGTGKNHAETVLQKLIDSIKNDKVELLEIELQRPGAVKGESENYQEQFDYVSKAFLDRLEDAQESVWNGLETNVKKIKLVNRPRPKYTEGNYCALHLLLKMNENNARTFELQVMGPYMGEVKGFDDIRFKFFHGKKVESKYNPLIKQYWEPLLAEENKKAKETFLKYFSSSIFGLRLREIDESVRKLKPKNINEMFKGIEGSNLPPEYDLNNQLKIKRECDARAKTAKKNLEKARQQKENNSVKESGSFIAHTNRLKSFSRKPFIAQNMVKKKNV